MNLISSRSWIISESAFDHLLCVFGEAHATAASRRDEKVISGGW